MIGIKFPIYQLAMSFQITDPRFLTFGSSDQFLLYFKFKIFILHTSLFTFYITHFAYVGSYMQLYMVTSRAETNMKFWVRIVLMEKQANIRTA